MLLYINGDRLLLPDFFGGGKANTAEDLRVELSGLLHPTN